MATYTEITRFEAPVLLDRIRIAPDDSTGSIYIHSGIQYFYKFNMFSKNLTEIRVQEYTTDHYDDFDEEFVTVRPYSQMTFCNAHILTAVNVQWEEIDGYDRTTYVAAQIYRIREEDGQPTLLFDSHNEVSDSHPDEWKIRDLNSYNGVLYQTLSYEDYYGVWVSFDGGNSWRQEFIPKFGYVCSVRPFSESQLASFSRYEFSINEDDYIRFGLSNWEIKDTAPYGSFLAPAWGCDHKFWTRDSNGDLAYTKNQFEEADYTPYGVSTFVDKPRIAQAPFGVDFDGKRFIVDEDGTSVNVYRDTDMDGTISRDDINTINDKAGCITFHGTFVIVSYSDNDGTDWLSVWKRNPDLDFPVKPRGLDRAGTQLYVTGSVYPATSPIMLEVEANTLASGIGFVAPGSGYIYPHAEMQGKVYLYGTLGPYKQCVLYSGWPNAQTVLPNLPSGSVITDLKTPPLLASGSGTQFVTVNGGQGAFYTAPGSADSITRESTTPWPSKCIYRAMGASLNEAGTFIGANTGQSCAIQFTDDLQNYEHRCDGIPSDVQITEIEGADYVESETT
jgi:hypothetical protein